MGRACRSQSTIDRRPAHRWSRTAGRGALFGLITYATYDLTDLATVQDWPLTVTVVDLLWGSFLRCAVGLAGFLVGRHGGGRRTDLS